MTQQKSPTVSKRQGLKKSITDREENTVNPLAGQGLLCPVPVLSGSQAGVRAGAARVPLSRRPSGRLRRAGV